MSFPVRDQSPHTPFQLDYGSQVRVLLAAHESINKVKADILLKIDCGFISVSQLSFKLQTL